MLDLHAANLIDSFECQSFVMTTELKNEHYFTRKSWECKHALGSYPFAFVMPTLSHHHWYIHRILHYLLLKVGNSLCLSSELSNIDNTGQNISMLLAESFQLWKSGHFCWVFFRDNFTQQPGTTATSQNGQIDSCFGVTVSGQYTALFCA